jgi:predicted O-methyltransferase YrrM
VTAPARLQWEPAAPGDGPPVLTSVQPDEAAELARLAAGRDCLEIGSAYGYSAIVMALAGGTVTAVDPHEGDTWLGDTLTPMRAALGAYGVTAEIVRQRSADALPALAAAGRRFGLIFIDGDHNYGAVLADVRGALRLLAPGGTLACHDYGEATSGGVQAALDELFPAGPGRLTGTLWMVTP